MPTSNNKQRFTQALNSLISTRFQLTESFNVDPNPESSDPRTPSIPEHNAVDPEPDRPDDDSSNSGGKEEEEEEECGFCLFMKSGGCKESFVAWENCVDEAEKNGDDIAAKCVEVTVALKKCMEDHPDYYEQILKAEKAVHEEVLRELGKGKAAKENSEKKN
ncbi:EXS (ERD1/XPR1/SYG1) family protein [Hibiscus syriacus]|uniref:EXS (ERD1/XPR1/SYG1) family protein n=1 Tax=Hibiscus syriacus TaxID=106335 RepID=A0A6A3B3H7_HIBSY|nr:EXS (ERD1/XPR1/SYG1) family protein [Hibiscus syriacus]